MRLGRARKFLARLWRREYLRAGLIILGLAIVFFGQVIFSDRLASPADLLQIDPTYRVEGIGPDYQAQNGLFGDVVIQMEPWHKLFRDALRDGSWPLWNPHQGNGVPHFANYQSATLYPLNWLVVIFGFKWGLLALYIGKLFLIGWCTYLYLRKLKLHHRAALFGAVAFEFSGFNIAWLYWPLTNAIFFLPFSLWLLERIFDKPANRWNYLWLALGLALALFGGHPETMVHLAGLIAAYLVYKLWTTRPKRGLRWSIILKLVGAGFLGTALAAVQLIPFVEYMRASVEWGLRGSLVENPFALNPAVLGGVFVPDLLGNQAWQWFGHIFFAEHAVHYNDLTGGYVGLVTLLLATLAVIYFARQAIVRLYVALAAVALMLVFKFPAWLFAAVTAFPFLDRTNNVRLLFVVAFALAVLASFFVHHLLTQPERKRSRDVWVIGLYALLTLLVTRSALFVLKHFSERADITRITEYLSLLTGYIPLVLLMLVAGAIGVFIVRGRIQWFVLTGLLVIEVVVHGMWYLPSTPSKLFFPESPAVSFLKQSSGNDRIISVSDSAHWWPNTATYYELQDPRVYDAMTLVDHAAVLDQYVPTVGNTRGVIRADANYLNLAGVRYVLASDQKELTAKLALTPKQLTQYPLAADFGEFKIFENKQALSRAFVVGSSAFLSSGLIPDVPTSLTSYQLNRVTIDVTMPQVGTLVLSDTFFPGWHVYVDGVERSVEKADLNFRSVSLEPGPHTVEFVYRPMSLILGGVISLVAALIWLAIAIVFRKRRVKLKAPQLALPYVIRL
jgi:hypothetical protein